MPTQVDKFLLGVLIQATADLAHRHIQCIGKPRPVLSNFAQLTGVRRDCIQRCTDCQYLPLTILDHASDRLDRVGSQLSDFSLALQVTALKNLYLECP